MTFARKLKAARGDRSVAEVAAAISRKLSVRTLEAWEADRQSPPEWAQELILAKLREVKA